MTKTFTITVPYETTMDGKYHGWKFHQEWCSRFLSKRWIYNGIGQFEFEDESEYAWFKLRWL